MTTKFECIFSLIFTMHPETKLNFQYSRDNKKLKEVCKKDYDFNLTCLVKKELLSGRIHYGYGGIENVALTGGITGDGLDVVERFVDEGIRNTIDAGHDVLKKSLSYSEQIINLVAIWYTDPSLLQKVLKSLISLIG